MRPAVSLRSLLVTLLILYVLVVGSVGLMAQGDFEAGGIGLLILTMFVFTMRAPFAGLPPQQRRTARLAATAAVLAGWFACGALVWGWTGASYGVAGAVALYALFSASQLPRAAADRSAPAAAQPR